jgi:putative flippase GtrA
MSFRTTLNERGILRWLRFNLVGAMGMAVQLAALALFNRWMRGHYLWASAAAVELTLLHNFLWHQHFTWRDRRDAAPWPQQLWRFHLSNGLVSLLGNLALMRLLVHAAHLPLLLANTLAILSCSVANFWLGNRWAFAATSEATHGLKKGLSAMRRISVLILLASTCLSPSWVTVASSRQATRSITVSRWRFHGPARLTRTTAAVSVSSCAIITPSLARTSTTSCCGSVGWGRLPIDLESTPAARAASRTSKTIRPACYNLERRRGAEARYLQGFPPPGRFQDAEVPQHVRPFKMGNHQA